jgi:hypothetical protein
MGAHFSKRRHNKSRTNSAVSPTTIILKEKILVELDKIQGHLDEFKNEQHRPPTPSPRILKDAYE